MKGEIPVYDDPGTSLRSIGRLQDLEGVRVLVSSWDRPRKGAEVKRVLEDGGEVIRTLHAAVVRAAGRETDPSEITRRVVEGLGLPEAALPVISRTVAGHIRAVGTGESM